LKCSKCELLVVASFGRDTKTCLPEAKGHNIIDKFVLAAETLQRMPALLGTWPLAI